MAYFQKVADIMSMKVVALIACPTNIHRRPVDKVPIKKPHHHTKQMATRLGTLHERRIIRNNMHRRQAVHEIVLTNPKVDLRMPICGVHQLLAHRGLILVDNVDVAPVFNPGEESEKNDARPQHITSLFVVEVLHQPIQPIWNATAICPKILGDGKLALKDDFPLFGQSGQQVQ